MTSYIGALDQGTTSTRFIVFDRSGTVVSEAQKEHQQIYPRPGWAEHDPEEIWRRSCEVIKEALAKKELRAADLAAVGIANQRETTVVWDRKTGKPVANAIVWQDVRVSADATEFSKSGGADRFRLQTGLPLSPYFSGLKIRGFSKTFPAHARKPSRGTFSLGMSMHFWPGILPADRVAAFISLT